MDLYVLGKGIHLTTEYSNVNLGTQKVYLFVVCNLAF